MTTPFPHHVLPIPAMDPDYTTRALFRATEPTLVLAAETVVARCVTWHLGVETIVHAIAKRAGLPTGAAHPVLRRTDVRLDTDIELAALSAAAGAWPEGFEAPPGLFEPTPARLETTRDDAGHVMRGILRSAGVRPTFLSVADAGMPSAIAYRDEDNACFYASPLIFLHDGDLYAAWHINPVDHVSRHEPISSLPDGRRWEQVDPATAPLPADSADLL